MNGPYRYCALTPEDLAKVVEKFRIDRGWSQEVLADIAGVTVRTVQRVESGKSSSTDTKRCLAVAFDLPNVDAFNEPWPIPSDSSLKDLIEIEENTVILGMEAIRSGRRLRELIDSCDGWEYNLAPGMTYKAERAFAEILEYLNSYQMCQELYTPIQKFDLDDDIQDLLAKIEENGCSIAVGMDKTEVFFGSNVITHAC